MKAQHQSYTWSASVSFHVKGVGSDSWKSRKGWEWLGRLWRLRASWDWVTIRKWGGRVRRRKLRSIWYLSQPGSWHCWTAWGMRPWCQKKGPEKLRTRLSFCIETQGLSKALWKSENAVINISISPRRKKCSTRDEDLCPTWPWPWLFSMRKEECTKQLSRTQPSSRTPHISLHGHSLCTAGNSLLIYRLAAPRLWAPWARKLFSLCFPKVMDRVSSPGMSVEWSVLGWEASGNDSCQNEVFTRFSSVLKVSFEKRKRRRTERES